MVETLKTKKSNKLWIKADKSKNFYKIKPSEYDKIVIHKITSSYKKDKDNSTISSINEDICKFANKVVGVADRMGKFNMKDAYILFKDHKPNFINSLQSRLINPSKSELWLISKSIIKKITCVLDKYPANLWKDLTETIKWFRKMPNKRVTFIQFDIFDFYPISEELLINSLNFAKGYTEITDNDLDIILASRSILTYNDATWVKKNNGSFDVPMRAFDSAQIADLVGIYIDTLSRVVNLNQVGIYRDDSLIIVPNINGHLTSSLHKKIIRAFKYLGRKIEISSNLKIVNFLDITLNLSNNTFKPFHKVDQTPLYTNVHSNHPKHVIDHIPKTVNTRINRPSSSQKNL